MVTGLVLAALFFATEIEAYPNCLADNGSGSVDTWVAFKGPKGTDYVFWQTGAPLAASSHDMNSTTIGALGETLSQLWSETTEYIIWNDEPVGESGYNFTTGHTKGVWAWNLATGDAIVLQHSVPLFPAGPSQTSKYKGLGSNAWMYGQHVACFETTVEALATLATLAPLTIPSIYDARTSGNTPAALTALAGGAASTAAVCDSLSFTTRGGLNVTYFAKSTQWNAELYANCIAPALGVSLAVESWIRGSACGPACGTETVLDVQDVSYPGGLSFSEYNDHSKWAVGLDSDWFCASDINRMTTQAARGGAAYCFQDSGLAAAMRGAATNTDSC